ncbi:sensor domain-containing phosphodiesterase [Methylomonas sp. LL1]|uniref:sensor domain-containing phosphodiesterase n=1 Tax=Methylomonas sp. LL1 TaxID=2785785 RepID=UPI0018C3F4F1|nr:EAL domain-containing protein [Methylomonas sp. LL1]
MTLDKTTEYIELDKQEQAKILQFQQDVLKLVVLGYDCGEVCEKLCLLEEQLLPNSVASVMLLDDTEQYLNVFVAPNIPQEGIAQLNGLRPGPCAGSCGNAIYRQEPVYVENAFTDPRWQDIRHLATDFNICACWSMPIRGKGGRVIGSFALSSFEHRLPGPFHCKLLEIGSFIIGIVLEQRKTNQQLHLSGKVFEHSTEGIMITDINNKIVSVNRAFTRITGYRRDEVLGKNPSLLSSEQHDPDFYRQMWQRIKAAGHWQGEIWNKTRDGSLYPQWLSITAILDEQQRVTHYLGIFSDISEKKQTAEIIWRQANYDLLTGLPNRNRFYDQLARDIKKAGRTGRRIALMFIDLDRFKEVNDAMGHSSGDALLNAAGKRLLSCVRDTDLVARLGGDEFTCILNDIANADGIEQISEQILHKLTEPFDLDGKPAYVSASIGITLYPDDALTEDALLKCADQAMYAAKNQGRNRWCFFTPAMQVAAEKRSRTASDLRVALANKQFYLLYQPIVELASGKVHKAEALIRWQHPEYGIISPAEFIPVAEETRMILDIGNWVFEQAVGQVAIWQATYGSEFQVSINKSPVQFYNESSQCWSDNLRRLGLSGHSIVVEITESLLLDASEQVSRQLLSFRDAGIQVAIDDFGTGYSSLAYLKKFDIDYLKIDQSFVRNLSSESSDLVLCEAIITMAHRLGMKVIAEGVETQQQCDLLMETGCDYAQGYLFSRPLSAEAFDGFITEQGRAKSLVTG